MRACRLCQQPFFLCPACDRGHAYCSLPCRREGRARTLRAAGRRHQQSPEGRLDHRDRQRAYRTRCRARLSACTAQAGVTHQTSPAPLPCGTLPACPPETPLPGVFHGRPGGADVLIPARSHSLAIWFAIWGLASRKDCPLQVLFDGHLGSRGHRLASRTRGALEATGTSRCFQSARSAAATRFSVQMVALASPLSKREIAASLVPTSRANSRCVRPRARRRLATSIPIRRASRSLS